MKSAHTMAMALSMTPIATIEVRARGTLSWRDCKDAPQNLIVGAVGGPDLLNGAQLAPEWKLAQFTFIKALATSWNLAPHLLATAFAARDVRDAYEQLQLADGHANWMQKGHLQRCIANLQMNMAPLFVEQKT